MSIVSVVALQGCQVLDAFDGHASTEAEPSIEVTTLPVDPAYPELRTVPPRPQLSYSVEQQREIVEGLIGDREHARYTSQRIRYRAGLSSLPPPPQPEPENVATATANAIVGDGQETPASAPAPRADVPAVGYGDISDPADTDDASLGDFMRNMIEETAPTSPAAEPSSSDDGPQPDPEKSSGVNPSPEISAASSSHSSPAPPSNDPSATRLFAWIDDGGTNAAPVDAAARDPSPRTPVAALPIKPEPGSDIRSASKPKPERGTANGPRPGNAAPVTVTFADGSAELPADATSSLEAALRSLEGDDVLELVGRGETLTLALDRARAVAVGLMRLGAGASALNIAAETAPAANDVRIRVGGRR